MTSRPPPPAVWVLQHVACETPGRIADALAAAGVAVRLLRPYVGEPVPAALDGLAGLVVMGGPMGVHDEAAFPFLVQERRLIDRALRADTPVLGVCLGSQLLAAALGARVGPGRRKEIGWHPVILTDAAEEDAVLAGAPPVFTAFHWHGDVFELPRGAVSLASSSLTACQAFRAGAVAYGLLCHLEVTERMLRDMVAAFAGELQREGIVGTAITRDAARYLADLQPIGDRVFAQWVALVAGRARADLNRVPGGA